MVTTDARDGEPQKISVRRQAFCSKDDLAEDAENCRIRLCADAGSRNEPGLRRQPVRVNPVVSATSASTLFLEKACLAGRFVRRFADPPSTTGLSWPRRNRRLALRFAQREDMFRAQPFGRRLPMKYASRFVANAIVAAVAVLPGATIMSAQATVDLENRYASVGAIMVWRVDDAGNPVELRGFVSGTLIRDRVMVTAGHFTAPAKALGTLPPSIRIVASFSPTNAKDPKTWIPVARLATHPSMPHCPPPPQCDPTDEILVAPLEPGSRMSDSSSSRRLRAESRQRVSRTTMPSASPKEGQRQSWDTARRHQGCGISRRTPRYGMESDASGHRSCDASWMTPGHSGPYRATCAPATPGAGFSYTVPARSEPPASCSPRT